MILPRKLTEAGPLREVNRKINEVIDYCESVTPRPTINSEVDHRTTGVSIRPKGGRAQAAATDDLTWL